MLKKIVAIGSFIVSLLLVIQNLLLKNKIQKKEEAIKDLNGKVSEEKWKNSIHEDAENAKETIADPNVSAVDIMHDKGWINKSGKNG